MGGLTLARQRQVAELPPPPPTEANRLAGKPAIRYAPVHGSLLDIAETKLSVLGRHRRDRHVPDGEAPQVEVAAWQERRDASARPVDRRPTAVDAGIRIDRLSPTVSE